MQPNVNQRAPVISTSGAAQQPSPQGQSDQPFYKNPDFWDRLAIGFSGMTLNPNEALINASAQRIDRRAEGRQTEKQRNATAEWLRSQGRDDLADAVSSGAIGGRDALGLMQPEKQDPYSTIGKLQADLSAGRISQEQYDVALSSMAPTGMSIETMPDGTTRIIQGPGAGVKLTEGQGKATGFYGRARSSDKILGDLEREGTRLYSNIVENVPIAGNYLVSEEFQRYAQAKRDFINAILRQESGAVIGPSEFANAEEQYFPQPGDSDAVIKQKRNNRKTAIEGLKVASGPGAGVLSDGETVPDIGVDGGGFSVTGRIK